MTRSLPCFCTYDCSPECSCEICHEIHMQTIINWHNVKMVLFLIVSIFSLGLSAMYPATGPVPIWVTLVSNLLMALEHKSGGNTSSTI